VGPILRPRRHARDRSRADVAQVEHLGAHELAARHTLEDVLARGPLEPERALELLAPVADALDAAQARGVVHSNLQPATIRIDASGGDRAVVDFSSDWATRGRPPRGAGSEAPLQYVSPEQILGRDEGPTSGVYSLSAVLYRCLTGSVPFPHGRERAVLFWHLHAPRPRVTDLRPDLPAAIDPVLARGMATDPAARHPTARALMEDARQALGTAADVTLPARSRAAGHEGRAKHAAGRPRQAVGRDSRRRRALISLGVVVPLALAAGALGFAVAGALDDPQPRPSLASAGPLQLAAPADWRRAVTTTSPASLRLTDPLVLAPTGSQRTRLVAGIATPSASVALLARLHASPPYGELVSLGQTQARRYRAARLPGLAGPTTLFVAPADRGIATVACLAEGAPAAASFMPRCERVAGSLHLAEGQFVPAGPSGRQATDLVRAFRRLNTTRSRYRSRLDQSRAPARQARAARTLVRVHVREARALRSLALTGLAEPGGRAAIRALEDAAGAYRAAARAAIRDDRGSYAAARTSAMAADAELRRALRMLRLVGYGA